MRIIFAGTTRFSAYYLNKLINSNYHIIGVFTQKYFPNNYEKFIYTNDVREIAQQHKLPIFQPNSLYLPEVTKKIQYLNPDIIIVVSYGLIIPQKILKIPTLGCINIHGSLLPKWRGAAPIQRAIEAGDTETGITIIQMDSGIDTGNILCKSICKILPNDTTLSLLNKLTNIGSTALLKILPQLEKGKYNAIPQNHKLSTYAKKINKNEGKINWDMSATQLERKIRAFNPWPVIYFQTHGKRIKIWQAKINNTNIQKNIQAGTILSVNKLGLTISTRHGSLILTKVQEEGKKIMKVKELLNSKKHWFTPGKILKN